MSNILNPVGVPDIIQTGTITANSGSFSNPATGSTVSLTSTQNGQSSWLASFAGTFSSGTTLVFEASPDNTNWYALLAKQIGGKGTISSLSGGANAIIRGNLAGFAYLRIRSTSFTTNDSVTVMLVASSGNAELSLVSPVMGTYSSSTPTLTDGQSYPLQQTINGFLKSSLADLLAGEDLTANVLKVEQRFNSAHYTTAQTNASVKATPGYVMGILVGIQGTGSSIITLADDTVTTNASTVVTNIDVNQSTGSRGFIPLYRLFSQAITVSSTGSTAPDFTVIYR